MTKEVIITIEGIQSGTGEEPILVTAPGIYHYINGRHFIQYEEKTEDAGKVSKNTIKISASNILLDRKTPNLSRMEFDLAAKTRTYYRTQYGDMVFDIKTESIKLEEGPDKIAVGLLYTLFTNEEKLSDNNIIITINAVQ